LRSTWLTELIEAELNGISLSVYLHTKMAAGWTQAEIRDDLEQRTGIAISQATVSRWTNNMGYAKRQAASKAWTARLISQAPMEERASPRRRAREFPTLTVRSADNGR
jgi:arginine repressor